MSHPATVQEAAERQDALWIAAEAGERSYNGVRESSMRAGYEMRRHPDYGLGAFSTNVETGEMHECTMRWHLDGRVLLCDICWLDGT